MAVKVRERPKGSKTWWVFIDHQGIRKAKKIGANKRLAKEVAEKIKAKLVLGDVGILKTNVQKIPIFKDYAGIWIKVTVPATCKSSTKSDYEGLLNNHILPVFACKPVNDINRLMVKNFLLKKINDGYATSTVIHMKNAISGVLNLAVDDEILPANPAHKIGKIFNKQNMNSQMEPLNKDELSHLLRVFQEQYPKHFPLALTLARTGMRLGETIGLQWGDIDFNGRFITIQRGLVRGKVETPKNGKIRKIDMSRQLTDTLLKLKHQRKIKTVKNGWKQMPEWVFVNSEGKPLDGNNWRKRVFNKALEKAKLRKVRVHDLRHTYASLLIQAGESLAYIRDQLGHHSIKVTVDIYGHLAPEGNKEAVDRLDDPTFSTTIRNLSATKTKKELTLTG